MKPGAWIALILSIVGFSAVVFSFAKNASPYVTVAQAKSVKTGEVHLKGFMDQESLSINSSDSTLKFILEDEVGERITVVHTGIPPSNMNEASEVVAVGTMEGDVFVANKLMLKCPSKYEGESAE